LSSLNIVPPLRKDVLNLYRTVQVVFFGGVWREFWGQDLWVSWGWVSETARVLCVVAGINCL